jgi:hypothetical protein
VDEKDLKFLHLASKANVDECAVRVQNVPRNYSADEIAFLFRDFDLQPGESITQLT